MKAPFVGRSKLIFSFVGMLLLIPGDHTPVKATAPATVSVDAVDLALDFVPGVCVVKDLLSLGLGVNLITGDPITSMDAAALIGWLLFPHAIRRTRTRLSNSTLLRERIRRLTWLTR